MIKVIVSDFDGCLNDALPGIFLDINLIEYIRKLNIEAASNPKIPFLIINSGRPQPYIEAHAQTLCISEFCVFENGVGIFRFVNAQMELIIDPIIPSTYRSDIVKIDEYVHQKYNINKQLGKVFTLTYLFPGNDPKIKTVADDISIFVQHNNLPYYVEFGINFININVKGISKATGLKLVAKQLKMDPKEMAAIGDSTSDWEFMKNCGFTACPNNSSVELKRLVKYISPFDYGKGLIDIIEKIIKMNSS